MFHAVLSSTCLREKGAAFKQLPSIISPRHQVLSHPRALPTQARRVGQRCPRKQGLRAREQDETAWPGPCPTPGTVLRCDAVGLGLCEPRHTDKCRALTGSLCIPVADAMNPSQYSFSLTLNSAKNSFWRLHVKRSQPANEHGL